MNNSPYKAYTQLAVELFQTTVRAHLQAIEDKKMLGEDPSPALHTAMIFEVGCLHLYALDHELRRGRSQDALLIELWHLLALYILGLYKEAASDSNYEKTLLWRLGRYEEVTAAIEAAPKNADMFAPATLEDYLTALAEQFLLCLQADVNCGETALFLGIVRPPLFDEEITSEKQHFSRSLLDTLYEHLLPIQRTAALWAQSGPFYEKTADELKALSQIGFDEAEALLREHKDADARLHTRLFWHALFVSKVRFALAPLPQESPSDDHRELPIVNNEQGYPYLRVVPLLDLEPDATEGIPVGNLLLMAHDLGVGLLALGPPKPDAPPNDHPLSLGEVDALLRRGSLFSYERTEPDFSDPLQLQVGRPDSWILSGSARVSLAAFYRRNAQTIQQELGEYTGGRISWTTDANGAGALILAPANAKVLAYATWLTPPGTVIAGEKRVNFARYDIEDTTDEYENPPIESQDSVPPPDKATPDGRAAAYDETTLFVRTRQVTYGAAGEPYEVVVQTDDEDAGRPLRDFALPCYDAGRGIALRSPHGSICWALAFGDLIGYLRDGKLVEAAAAFGSSKNTDAAKPAANEPSEVLFADDIPVTRPDRLTVPRLTESGIGWVMRRAGVASPRIGLATTTSGEPMLCCGPIPELPDLLHWAHWRVAWYLPIGSPLFAFVNDPVLTPFPLA